MVRGFWRVFAALWVLVAASGHATSPSIRVRLLAEVERKSVEGGREIVKLAPADRVVPGDEVIYTVEVRNTGSSDVVAPLIVRPVPTHMRLLGDSATGPGAEVTYSIDGGRVFDRAENLTTVGSDHRPRRATAGDYTHIRWQLKSTLKPKSVAYARFRALVK